MIPKIKKRNGRIVDFEPEKITLAIWKAVQSVGGTNQERAKFLTQIVISLLEEKYKEQIPSVEHSLPSEKKRCQGS
jgi:anaerobic ribonucleoside-triphosphate reductase